MIRLKRKRAWLGSVFLFISITVSSALAQIPSQKETLKVGTRIIPPFVIEEEGKLTGFSLELWQGIARELNRTYNLQVYPTVTEQLTAVKSGQVDVGVAAISITASRERDFDFSQPILESGLQILVSTQNNNTSLSFISLIFSLEMLKLVGGILLLVLVPAHLVWFFERRNDQGFLENKKYFPGIFKAGWWAIATLGAQADEMPKGAVGRGIAVIWMFFSVVFIAYFTAAVTTSLTVERLQGRINSPEDLPGQQIATVSGSTAAEYLKTIKARTLEFSQIQDAYQALLMGKAEAVVFDSPVLMYYASHEGLGKVKVVGNSFRQENYGIVLPINSPYRKPINSAILRLRETGEYQSIYDKWFGED